MNIFFKVFEVIPHKIKPLITVNRPIKEKILINLVDMSPRGIREHLKLNRPIYVPTSAYGHFGRDPDESVEGSFSWEKTDLVDDILKHI